MPDFTPSPGGSFLVGEDYDLTGDWRFYGTLASAHPSGGTVNVLAFGAKGDGRTNDQPAIQTALDRVADLGGGTVLLPPGTYLLNGTLFVESHVTLAGCGPTSVLAVANQAALTGHQLAAITGRTVYSVVTNRTRTGTADTGITLRDFAIEGNGDNQPTSQTLALVWFDNCEECDALNLWVRDATYGVNVAGNYAAWCFLGTNCSRVLVRGGHYERAGYACIEFRDNSYDSMVTGATIRDGAVHGFQVMSAWYADANTSRRLALTNCAIDRTASGTSGTGITIHGNANGPGMTADITIAGNTIRARSVGVNIFDAAKRVLVTGNAIESERQMAVRVGNATFAQPSDVTVAGNVALQSGEVAGIGIQVYDALRCSVVGNRVMSLGTGGHGITAESGSAHITISGNTVQADPGGSGIRVRNTTSGAVVVGNTVTAGLWGVRAEDTSTNVLIAHNNVTGLVSGGALISTSGAVTVQHNRGFVTENNGTATVPNGATTVTVTHGLSRTPALEDIVVTPTNNLGNAAKYWISTPTATQFTINVNADPGAGTATFVWDAEIR